MAKFCTNCGSEIKPGTKFCENCGQKLEQEQKPQEGAGGIAAAAGAAGAAGAGAFGRTRSVFPLCRVYQCAGNFGAGGLSAL